MLPSPVMVALALLLPFSHQMVRASRTADEKSVEVSAGSHFVNKRQGNKDAAAGKSVLSEIQSHSDSTDSRNEITPEMRNQVSAFSKLAVRALESTADAGLTKQDKAKNIQAALAQAANALESISSLADMEKKPQLTQKLAHLKSLTATSLIQKGQDDMVDNTKKSGGIKMTPEMSEQLRSFSKVAMQALGNAKNADMSAEEKSKHVQAALAQAAHTMTSMASLGDMKKSPLLAEKLAALRELTAPKPQA